MKVVVRKKTPGEEIPIYITTDFIKLESALKLAGAVPTGGIAKNLIAEGETFVNGEVCTMRGKKLHPGDTMTFLDQTYKICADGTH
jgi:ribosome-associated protein